MAPKVCWFHSVASVTDMMQARDKYREDLQYRLLVDTMYNFIARAEFDPTEIRQAAILAHIMYSERNVMPILMNQTLREFLKEEEEIQQWK